MQITLANRAAEIGRLQDEFEAFARHHKVPDSAVHAVQLALEELLTNILHYAYEDAGDHSISIRLDCEGDALRIEVEDDGRAFDLTSHPPPDLSLPLADRPIGGLGIHMIRRSLDQVDYRRAGGRNIVTLRKRFKSESP
jgi:anti-sigma regulatory factor (Ser/Thr protein kinase)